MLYALAQRAVLAFFSVQGAVWLSKIGWPFVQLLDIHLISHNDDDGDDDYYAEYICSNLYLPCLSAWRSLASGWATHGILQQMVEYLFLALVSKWSAWCSLGALPTGWAAGGWPRCHRG